MLTASIPLIPMCPHLLMAASSTMPQTSNWFLKNNSEFTIILLNWSSQYPDLNLIEYLQDALLGYSHRVHLTKRQQLCAVITWVWTKISEECVSCSSMKKDQLSFLTFLAIAAYQEPKPLCCSDPPSRLPLQTFLQVWVTLLSSTVKEKTS